MRPATGSSLLWVLGTLVLAAPLLIALGFLACCFQVAGAVRYLRGML